MKVNGIHYRSIWFDGHAGVCIIDQRWLPHELRIATLPDRDAVAVAISEMWVRGAPLIGATAAYGVALQMRDDPSDQSLDDTWQVLNATRPTAINLRWALDRCRASLADLPLQQRARAAFELAAQICEEDIAINRRIGEHGLSVIRSIHQQRTANGRPADEPVRVLTHCNAGWLATVDWGTATSPIYHAADAGVPLHVWVDETRPRNQGALTAWELRGHGVPHSYIVDNAGGHLMQQGQVDLVIVGTDRTTASGDVCNKIGTYLKALAAYDNEVPFYVALPSPTIDWSVQDGPGAIPIEHRAGAEVTTVHGRLADGGLAALQVTPDGCRVDNPAFDITPARLVTGLITERGICRADTASLADLFTESAAPR